MPSSITTFYWRCIKAAFAASWGVSDYTATAIGIFLPPLAKIVGISEATMSALAWQIPLAVFAAVGIARILIAPYFVFRQESSKAIELEGKLSEATASGKPKFVGEIIWMLIGEDPLSDNGSSSLVAYVIIRNKGESSIAYKWSARIIRPDGTAFVGQIRIFDEMHLNLPPSASPDGNQRVQKTVSKTEHIASKGMLPIQRGGAIDGYVAAMFRDGGRQSLDEKGNVVEIECHDVEDFKYIFARAYET